MNHLKKFLPAVLLIPLLAACHRGSVAVVHDPPPPDTVVVVHEPGPEYVVVSVEEEDACYVLYREYYDCTEQEISFIPHYRRYYAVDDCDLFFLFYVARHTRQPIDIVIRSYYYDCGRDHHRLVLFYRLDPVIFFVDLPRDYHPGGPFDRPYRFYRERSVARARFTNVEYRALVSLKIGVEYQGEPPEKVVRFISETPAAPQKAIVRSHDRLGAGGRNARGQRISTKAPRPWTMPAQEREKVRAVRQETTVRNERVFREKHGQRVNESRRERVEPKERRPERSPEPRPERVEPKEQRPEPSPEPRPERVEPKEQRPEPSPEPRPERVEPKERRPERSPEPRNEEAPAKERELEQERERQRLEKEKQLEQQKEMKRRKELEKQKKPPKDPKSPKDPKKDKDPRP